MEPNNQISYIHSSIDLPKEAEDYDLVDHGLKNQMGNLGGQNEELSLKQLEVYEFEETKFIEDGEEEEESKHQLFAESKRESQKHNFKAAGSAGGEQKEETQQKNLFQKSYTSHLYKKVHQGMKE
mmetsp:Transcript_3170/g.5293  ORF Transcript_3170/g.5293 Transcript_3170/m.5293 type:complete len:125 (+) Transcript_3170:186-560(+)